MRQDLWTLLEENKLRMVSLPEGPDPWTHNGSSVWAPQSPVPAKRNQRVAVLASLLVLVEACYILMHFIP